MSHTPSEGAEPAPRARRTLALLPLVVSLLAAAPLAAAGPTSTHVYGRDGEAVPGSCDPPGAGASDGATFLFGGAGCTASFNLTEYGFANADNVVAARLLYNATGHPGSICGFFTITGRWHGQTPTLCAGPDQAVLATTQEGTLGSGPLLWVTWHPTNAATDVARLCWVDVLGEPPSLGGGTHGPEPCATQYRPCAPGLTATARADGTILLDWPPVDGSTAYQVVVRQTAPTIGDWMPLSPQVPPASHTFTYTGGAMGGGYEFVVDALQGGSNVTVVYCSAFASFAPTQTTEVPVFPSALSLVLAAAGIASAGFLLVRRRP